MMVAQHHPLPRFCKLCSGPLVQNGNEPDYDFRARVSCLPSCIIPISAKASSRDRLQTQRGAATAGASPVPGLVLPREKHVSQRLAGQVFAADRLAPTHVELVSNGGADPLDNANGQFADTQDCSVPTHEGLNR